MSYPPRKKVCCNVNILKITFIQMLTSYLGFYNSIWPIKLLKMYISVGYQCCGLYKKLFWSHKDIMCGIPMLFWANWCMHIILSKYHARLFTNVSSFGSMV
jgi:hypothetical protein